MPNGGVTPGGGGGGTFNGGTITRPLTIDLSGFTDANPALSVKVAPNTTSDNADIILVSDEAHAAILELAPADFQFHAPIGGGNAEFSVGARDHPAANSTLNTTASNQLLSGILTSAITAGALPTTSAFVSGTGKQISTARDVFLAVPITYNPTAGAAATCAVALSPDDVTYSTVGTPTEPAGIALDGTIHLLTIPTPAGWYVKLTVTNATIGTGTYY